VPEVLELVGLAEKSERMPHELSGGQQQRVSVARAFVNNPRILLCDEPTGNLDPSTSVGIMKLLDRINRTGTTVVMATHDQHIVDSMRRRVIELENGLVCATSPAASTATPADDPVLDDRRAIDRQDVRALALHPPRGLHRPAPQPDDDRRGDPVGDRVADAARREPAAVRAGRPGHRRLDRQGRGLDLPVRRPGVPRDHPRAAGAAAQDLEAQPRSSQVFFESKEDAYERFLASCSRTRSPHRRVDRTSCRRRSGSSWRTRASST
jgi:energy-coupling factor transporter ATP-binding protein EcfA2